MRLIYPLLLFLLIAPAFGQSTVTYTNTGSALIILRTNLNARFETLTNTAATASSIAGYDANKKLGSITVGSGLSFSAGTLSATGGGGTNLSEVLVNGSSVVNANFKDGTNSVIWAIESLTNIFAFPTNILGNQIFDGTIAAADLGTDSVSADELNASGVEAELESVLDLQDQQGAVVAAQVPDILAFDILTVNDDAYAAGWNASTNVPTKNAIYDKIESLSLGTSIYVNGSSVSAPNLASGTNLIWAVSDSTNVYGFPTNIVASQLATDSVSADELNATGVEAELEAVLDLDQIQGQIGDGQIADGAVDGGTGGEIADASVTAADLATDSVSADELNAAGVEAELEAVLDLQDMQGAVIAVQVPDDLAFDDLTANTLVVSNTISAGSGNGQIDLGAAGVRQTSDGDGAITFLGLGNGFDEDFTLNLDDTENTGVISSSTGLNVLDFSSIALQVPTEVYGAGWDADNTVPTKDAVYDKIETIVGASGDQVLINGSGITNPNFMDGTNSVIFAIGDATNVFAFPTNILGNQIFDGTVEAADLGTDSVSADELNATGVEAELEAVIDLPDLQGTLTRAKGGTGADTSSYGAGLLGSDGSNNTIDVDTEAELETALGGADVVVVATDDITSANLRTTLSDEVGTGPAMFTRVGVYRTIYVDAGAMVARTTAGATTGTEELASNDIMMDYFAFDDTTDEGVQFKVMMPDAWDLGTVKVKLFWYSASATTSHTAVWGVKARAVSNDDVLDGTWGTEVEVSDDVIAAGDLHVTAATAAITVGGTPALGDLVMFEIDQDATEADHVGDVKLTGIAIQYLETTTESSAW